MFGFIGLIILIILLTTILAAILFGTNIIEIKNNWAERRCDPYVMFTAPFYQQSDDTRSSTDFAIDNFMFCINSLSNDALSAAFAPIYETLKGFFGTINIIQDLMNNFRSYFGQLRSQFESILGDRFHKFISVFDLFRVGIKKLESAFSRNNAILIATLFQGMSGFTFIQNFVQFILKVVIIIIAILAALVIFLFFIMFPVIPVILTTIGIITAAGFGAAVGSYTGAFCLHPSTNIILQDGTYKPINKINLGDILTPSIKTHIFPNQVYGILETEGALTNLYEIDGVKLSGSHRVLEKGKWLLAEDIKRAVKINEKADRLYILNTRHHWLSAIAKEDKPLIVSDWEEVSTERGQDEWHKYVAVKLGAKIDWSKKATSIPLIGEDVKVHCLNNKKRVSRIAIGDYVIDDKGETRVLAVYKGYLGKSVEGSQWLSDGNWVFDGMWKQNNHGEQGGDSNETLGYQIITESGSFKIQYNNKDLLIRDFTECGIKHIEGCYSILDDHII
jgi:hypothetical protein